MRGRGRKEREGRGGKKREREEGKEEGAKLARIGPRLTTLFPIRYIHNTTKYIGLTTFLN